MKIRFTKVHPNAKAPYQATMGSAGWDLFAVEDALLMPGATVVVPLGLIVEVTNGYEGQLRCRSSMALDGIIMTNGVGTVDSDYRGELKAIFTNTTTEPMTLSQGDRIVQLLICPVTVVEFEETSPDELTETDRGTGGFGSTGV